MGVNARRNLIFIGLLAIIFVLVLIVLVVINYFNVVPLSKIAPPFLGWLPSNNESKLPPGYSGDNDVSRTKRASSYNKAQTVRPYESGNVKISVVSELPQYSISIEEDKVGSLKKLLEDWNILGKSYDFYGKGTTFGEPLEKITFHLTTIPQELNTTTVEGEVAFSSDIQINKNTMDVYVHLAPFVLAKQKEYTRDAGEYFDGQVLLTFFRLANQTESLDEQKALDQKMINEIKNVLDKDKSFFVIK